MPSRNALEAQAATMLFLGALLTERALEILVGTWRSAGATQLEVRTCDRNLARLRQAQADEGAVMDGTAALEHAKAAARVPMCHQAGRSSGRVWPWARWSAAWDCGRWKRWSIPR
jgi:hypothetical protein